MATVSPLVGVARQPTAAASAAPEEGREPGRLVGDLAPSRSRQRLERLGADALAVDAPRPRDETVDEESRGDVAVHPDHRLAVLLRQDTGAVGPREQDVVP